MRKRGGIDRRASHFSEIDVAEELENGQVPDGRVFLRWTVEDVIQDFNNLQPQHDTMNKLELSPTSHHMPPSERIQPHLPFLSSVLLRIRETINHLFYLRVRLQVLQVSSRRFWSVQLVPAAHFKEDVT